MVAEQIEIAIKLDHLGFVRHGAADAVAQHGKIVGDEERGVAGCGPERVLDLITLIYHRRVEKLSDVPGVVHVEMPKDQIFDVRWLDADFRELGIDGYVGRTARIQGSNERTPIARVRDDLVVVAAIEQHVPIWMLDQEKPDRNFDFSTGTVLNDRFVEV